MKIGDLAKQAGLTAYTIRYYERIGLLPPADRHASGIRDYDPKALIWIGFLQRLKTTGMPLRDMLTYAALRNTGAGSIAERHDLLVRHRASLCARLTDLNASLVVLDAKIASYAAPVERTISHDHGPQ